MPDGLIYITTGDYCRELTSAFTYEPDLNRETLVCECIYIIYDQSAAVSLFESSSVQLRSNEDLEGLECSNYC